MITQQEFSKIRPELFGDHCEFEYTRDGFYGLEFLGGRFELYHSHGVELAFGSKIRTKPAFLRISRVIDEQLKFDNGDPDMVRSLVNNLFLPCKLLMTLDELHEAIPHLQESGNSQYHIELEWLLLRFHFEEDQLSCIELFDIERCQKNVYANHNEKIDVRKSLIEKNN